MHIMEGFLPAIWCVVWIVLSVPFVAYGIKKLEHMFREKPELKPLIAVVGAFIFILSAIKIPSVAGSSSHATGTGMAAILFGPAIASVMSVIVLLYQTLFLAHGGITTLGANVFSMGIAGPIVAYTVYKACLYAKINMAPAIFLAATLGDLTTYTITSIQLALAFPAPTGGVIASMGTFMGIFGITQIPIAIIEGLLTVAIFKYVQHARADLLAGFHMKNTREVDAV
ncbi:MAG: energy-coupling factor ABC transporter permease [Methanosarcinales archaeon]|nr:energy-coupling factor ABC transporter permease [Methanosarcinales archaeon]